MGILDDTIVKAKETFDVVAKKSTEMIEVQKIRYQISSLNSKISKQFELLGKITYDAEKNEAGDEKRKKTVMTDIDAKFAELEELEDRLSAAKKMKICVMCGGKNNSDAGYCSKCGAGL